MLDFLFFSVVALIFGLTFVATGTFVAIIMAMSYLSLRLLSDHAHKTLCYVLADIFWSIFPVFCLKWGGLELSIYGEPQVLMEWNIGHNIVLENHNYEIDFIVGYCVLYLANIVGSSKLVGKKILSYVPVQGPVWYFTDNLFVKRVWKEDELMIKSYADVITKYPKNLTITLLFHPEATRFTPSKHLACVNYCKERGLKPLRNLLTPRIRGFTAIVTALRKNFDHLIDTTLLIRPVGDYSISVRNLLLRKKFIAELHCNVHDIKNIPEDLGKWLMDSYYFKDDLMDYFKKEGTIGQSYDLLTSSLIPNDINYRCLMIFFISFCFYGVFVTVLSGLTGVSTLKLVGGILSSLYVITLPAIRFLTVPE